MDKCVLQYPNKKKYWRYTDDEIFSVNNTYFCYKINML